MDSDISYKLKTKLLWLYIKPLLSWAAEELINKFNITETEAESELYILCYELIKNYNISKSSVVPYLVRFIPLYYSKTVRKLEKEYKKYITYGLKPKEESYNIEEEYYWQSPKILLENKYVGKVFTKEQKYLISIIITLDNPTCVELASKCNISRETMRQLLQQLKNTLEDKACQFQME